MSETRIEGTLDTAWWWEALRSEELLVPTCRTCDKRFFPPQPFCNNCGSKDWYGAQSGGMGKIYSWVVIHRPFAPEYADKVPYAIVAVDLDEGCRLIGRYLGDLDLIRDGLPVHFRAFREAGEALLGFEAVAQTQDAQAA